MTADALYSVTPTIVKRSFEGDNPMGAREWMEQFIDHMLEEVGVVVGVANVEVVRDPSTRSTETILLFDFAILAQPWQKGERINLSPTPSINWHDLEISA